MLEINGTIVFFVISFILFVFVLDKILWSKIQEIKVSRSHDIFSADKTASITEEKVKLIMSQIESEAKEIKMQEQNTIKQILYEMSELERIEIEKLHEEMRENKKTIYKQLQEEKLSFKELIDKEAYKLANVIVNKVY